MTDAGIAYLISLLVILVGGFIYLWGAPAREERERQEKARHSAD
jgi:hypothetical protein